jgi:hypothetical protein
MIGERTLDQGECGIATSGELARQDGWSLLEVVVGESEGKRILRILITHLLPQVKHLVTTVLREIQTSHPGGVPIWPGVGCCTDLPARGGPCRVRDVH